MSINSFDELPDHIIAAMSHAERNYHRALLDGPHIGAGFITSHRQLEARMADLTTRKGIANYFPEVALSTFESFAETRKGLLIQWAEQQWQRLDSYAELLGGALTNLVDGKDDLGPIAPFRQRKLQLLLA